MLEKISFDDAFHGKGVVHKKAKKKKRTMKEKAFVEAVTEE